MPRVANPTACGILSFMKTQIFVVALALAGAVWMKGLLAQEAATNAAPAAVAASSAGVDAPYAEAPKEISGVDQEAGTPLSFFV